MTMHLERDFRDEIVTSGFIKEEMSEIKDSIKKLQLMVGILIILYVCIIILNPSFVEIIKAIFK